MEPIAILGHHVLQQATVGEAGDGEVRGVRTNVLAHGHEVPLELPGRLRIPAKSPDGAYCLDVVAAPERVLASKRFMHVQSHGFFKKRAGNFEYNTGFFIGRAVE